VGTGKSVVKHYTGIYNLCMIRLKDANGRTQSSLEYIYVELSKCYKTEGDDFSPHIITGDDTWIHS
jgi:hypothetical protein